MAKGRIVTKYPDFIKAFNSLTHGRFGAWEVWQDFVIMVACAISNSVDKSELHYATRENLYLERLKKYEPEEQKVFPELLTELVNALQHNQEQDFLGDIFMQLELSNHWKGQFFTPYSLCRLMAEMNVDQSLIQIHEKGCITVNDPACGAGATLIAFVNTVAERLREANSPLNWQDHILVTAQDIDTTVGLMCYIQLSLLGAAGYVKIGNTLTDPEHHGDSKENYWYTPMYFHETWHYRRLVQSMENILSSSKSKEKTA